MRLDALRSGGFVCEHPTGRTRSAFNVRPAPVPLAFAGVTRVGHESCPWPCGLPVWCNEPPDTKGTHHGTQQYRTRAGDQSAGLPRLACRQQGREGFLDPHRSRVVPPRPQGSFASIGSGADQWPDRPAHAAGRREEGTGRLAPGLRADRLELGRKGIVRFRRSNYGKLPFCARPLASVAPGDKLCSRQMVD